jgi:hypothetical protein
MTSLWPQLPEVAASRSYELLSRGEVLDPAIEHPAQLWSPVGGRVKAVEVRALVEELEGVAKSHGYPTPAGNDARVAFDRSAAQVLRKRMDLDSSEAGRRNVWSFSALVLLPHLTRWRFGIGNRERWVATDLTRHTWARLWWQAVVFDGHEVLLESLTESDLNQLLERRRIGGDPRLVCALAEAVLAVDEVPRRLLIRDASLRLGRWLAFLDLAAVDDQVLRQLCDQLVAEFVNNYQGDIR